MSRYLTDRYGHGGRPMTGGSPGGVGLKGVGLPNRYGNGDARREVKELPLEKLLTNRILSSLPADLSSQLLPELEPVHLSAGKTLDPEDCDDRYVYFPEDAVVSHLCMTEDGGAVEAALTGKEGVTGLCNILGDRTPTHQTSVTIPGTALRMKTEVFQSAFRGGGPFQRQLLDYVGDFIVQVSQRAACNALHVLEKRLAVWLLLITDRTGDAPLPLTQDLMARRLGSRRAGISELACKLQEQGNISYSRGNLRVLDREALERNACECYEVFTHIRPVVN